MQDTGWLSPTTTGDPGNDWTNPTNGYTEDGNFVTAGAGESYQDYKGFGASIPATATITGVEFRVKAKTSSGSFTSFIFQLLLDRTEEGVVENPTLSVTNTFYTYGGPTDLMDKEWTPADFNSDAAHMVIENFGSVKTTYVDVVQMKIYYTTSKISDTGWRSPTTTGISAHDFTNPTYAYATDGLFATAIYQDNQQDYGGFNFNIPTNAIIQGIEYRITAKASTGSQQLSVQLFSTSSDDAFPATFDLTTTNTVYFSGGPTDLGDVTYIPSDFTIDNPFLMTTNQDATISVDHVEVKVFYTTNEALIDSYSEVNGDTEVSVYGNNVLHVGQSFTGNGGTLSSARFYLKKTGSPWNSIWVNIYAHSGTFGTSSVPTGTPLATSRLVNVSSLPGSFALIPFIFTEANKIILSNGTNYVATYTYLDGNDDNTTSTLVDTTTPTAPGNYSYNYTTWVATAGWDLPFYIYGDAPPSTSQDTSVKANIKARVNDSVKADILVINNTYSNKVKAWICLTRDISVKAMIKGAPSIKRYEYRVYNGPNGSYNTTWSPDVISDVTYNTVINGGSGEIVVSLARHFDDFGEGDDVTLNNRVDLWCFDQDSPNGIKLFSGYISGYRPILDGGSEHLEVTVLNYVNELTNYMLRNPATGSTTLAYNSWDPSNILKDVIDKYRADGGFISYTATSIDTTGTTVSYTYNTNTTREALDIIVQLAPVDWYWYISESGVIHFHYKETAPLHIFTLGREVIHLETWRRIEDMINRVYFTGAGDPSMFRLYSDSGSIAAYGLRAVKQIDQRVTVNSTADLMAANSLDKKSDPEIRTLIYVVDNNGSDKEKGYNIESIHVGDRLKIRNLKQGVKTISLWDIMEWDVDVWDQTLAYSAADEVQVQAITYAPNLVQIQASSITPVISKRVEDVYRNLASAETVNNPSIPTVVP